MATSKQHPTNKSNDGATVGCETQRWRLADALLGSMDAAITANPKELRNG